MEQPTIGLGKGTAEAMCLAISSMMATLFADKADLTEHINGVVSDICSANPAVTEAQARSYVEFGFKSVGAFIDTVAAASMARVPSSHQQTLIN